MKNFFAIFLVALVGCGPPDFDDSAGMMSVILGQIKLEIPKKYILPSLPDSIISSRSGLDQDDSVLLEIPLRDLHVNVDAGGGLRESIIVHIFSGTGSRSMGPSASEAWRSEGLFRDRVVEYDEVHELYRVYPGSGYPMLWHFFKNHPDEILDDVAAGWVASCRASFSKQRESIDLSGVTCKSVSFYETVESEITWAGENFKFLNVIIKEYEKLLASWIKT